jgi:hypothetical protein
MSELEMKTKSRSHPLQGIIGFIVCGILLVVITFGTFFLTPASVRYHVEEKYTFSSAGPGASIHLGVLAPQSGPYQEIKNLSITWDGTQEIETQPSVEAIKLTAKLPQGSEQEAIINYDVVLPQGGISWLAPVEDFQLRPQPGIESDHPSLKEAVSYITTGSSRLDAYYVYQFTSQHLTYSEEARDCVESSALSAYRTGKGVCSEYARLMVALNRAAGIPAQMITGIFMPDLVILGSSKTREGDHAGESHAWVEFYTNGVWTIADPTLGSSYLDRLYFGRGSGHFLSFGEYQQESKAYTDLQGWASSQGDIIAKSHAGLKYIASADQGGISLNTSSNIKKGWDGRWASATVALGLSTMILCALRNRFARRSNILPCVEESKAYT